MTPQLTDPVCGMTVTTASEHHYTCRNTDYYFCCSGCRDKFAADPGHYLNPPEATQKAAGDSEAAAWICPMCPEVRESEPVPCPGCGMALEPEAPRLPETRTEYSCPMHPEIVQDEPGSCPRCGMALAARTVTLEERNEELVDMTRRFRISTALALPVFVLAMIADMQPGWLPARCAVVAATSCPSLQFRCQLSPAVQ